MPVLWGRRMAMLSFLGPTEKIALRPDETRFVGGAGPTSNELPFQVEPQMQTQWCWAAVASSISKFYDSASAWTQCSVANAQLAKNVCCDPQAAQGECNKQSRLDQALEK